MQRTRKTLTTSPTTAREWIRTTVLLQKMRTSIMEAFANVTFPSSSFNASRLLPFSNLSITYQTSSARRRPFLLILASELCLSDFTLCTFLCISFGILDYNRFTRNSQCMRLQPHLGSGIGSGPSLAQVRRITATYRHLYIYNELPCSKLLTQPGRTATPVSQATSATWELDLFPDYCVRSGFSVSSHRRMIRQPPS